jgi:hypothetical protein
MPREYASRVPLTLLLLSFVLFFGLPASAQTEPGEGWGEPPPDVEEPPPEAPAEVEEAAPEGGWGAPPAEVEGDVPESAPPPEGWSANEAGAPTAEAAAVAAEPTVEEDLPALEEEVEPPSHHQFGFGSYGRAGVGTDFHGQTARPVSVVTHAPRVVESPYLEMDFYYTMDPEGPSTIRTVTTVAFTEDLFHYTGDWSAMIALRNLYAEFDWDETVSVWAGSRMYRGDDIYLLDFWPLDSLNTVGGGLGFRRGRWDAAWHMGVNRLRDEFTFQEFEVPDRRFGAQSVVLMDRQRLITSLSAGVRLLGQGAEPSLRLKVYFELHYLADGAYRREDLTDETLPSDVGWTGGFQLGSWGWGERASHANLFLRYSQGLAAYGEMGIPFGVNAEKRTWPNASELLIGVSANYERGRFGVMGAGYLRRFTDADQELYDEDDGWELVVDVRPWVVLWGPLQLALDLSYQARFPSGMSPTALEVLNPGVFQAAPMLIFAPLGPGSYARPHIRLMYRYAHLNEGALDTYALEDPRRNDQNVHYFGIMVEWWYNSSYR